MADGLTKTLGPERHRKLAKMMGMGVWQKSGEEGKEDEGNGEGSNVAEVRGLRLGDHQVRSGSDERTSSPISPGLGTDVARRRGKVTWQGDVGTNVAG